MQRKQIKKASGYKIQEKVENFLLSDAALVTVTKLLLMSIAMGGIIVVGATLPGVVKAIGLFSRRNRKFKYTYPKKKIANSLAYLKHKKLIEILEEKGGKTRVRLTNKGRKRLLEYSLKDLKIKKPTYWDGKWRMLMFDIPAYPKKYNYARNALRSKVKEMGFYQVQKSVWAYPYECEDELLFIAEIFKVQQYIEILTVDKILHEKKLREKFSLL